MLPFNYMPLASLAFFCSVVGFLFKRRTKKCTWNWSQDTCLGASLFSICLGMPIMSIWKRQVIHRPREYKLGKLLLLLVLSPYCTNSSGGPRVPCGDRWHSQIIQDLSNQSTTPLESSLYSQLSARWKTGCEMQIVVSTLGFIPPKNLTILSLLTCCGAKKRERSERHLIENDQRNKFYLTKESKSGSEMSRSGRPQNYQKAKVHNFFFVFFIRKKIGTCAF